MAYLHGHFVLEDEKEEKIMALRTRNYEIINEDMYRGGRSARLSSSAFCEMKAGNCRKRYMQGCALLFVLSMIDEQVENKCGGEIP